MSAKKLTLALESLSIESFETSRERREAGTVQGHQQCTCVTACTCPGCPTCDATCNQATCGTCNQVTCAASCNGTCQCGPATCLQTNCFPYECCA